MGERGVIIRLIGWNQKSEAKKQHLNCPTIEDQLRRVDNIKISLTARKCLVTTREVMNTPNPDLKSISVFEKMLVKIHPPKSNDLIDSILNFLLD